jgi:hypothetical protein
MSGNQPAWRRKLTAQGADIFAGTWVRPASPMNWDVVHCARFGGTDNLTGCPLLEDCDETSNIVPLLRGNYKGKK